MTPNAELCFCFCCWFGRRLWSDGSSGGGGQWHNGHRSELPPVPDPLAGPPPVAGPAVPAPPQTPPAPPPAASAAAAAAPLVARPAGPGWGVGRGGGREAASHLGGGLLCDPGPTGSYWQWRGGVERFPGSGGFHPHLPRRC